MTETSFGRIRRSSPEANDIWSLLTDRAPWYALADVATQRPIPRLWQRCGPPHLRVHLPCLAQSSGSLGQSHGWGRGSLLLACWSGSSLSSVRGFGDALRNPAEH